MSEEKAPEKAPVTVLISGAAGQICYSLIFMIAQGSMLGSDQPINLRLLDIPPCIEALHAVVMEIYDGAFPLLRSIVPTTDYKEAFTGIDVALLVGARPRGPGMERKDLLKANASIFEGQGKAINDYAKKTVKVLVVGNPANTNALIAMHHAPSIPKSAWSALTRLDQHRAVYQVAAKAGVPVSDVKRVIIWGNHSSTQYPDVNHATIGNTSVRKAIKDDKWLDEEFVTTVQNRGAAVIKARKSSSAASAANAVVCHVRDWILGTPEGTYSSMAVVSDGSYNVPEGLIFSFPCICKDGKYEIVKGLKISEAAGARLNATAAELLEEKEAAFSK